MRYTILYVIAIVLILAICIGLAYLVAISDMPDWLKFFLLK